MNNYKQFTLIYLSAVVFVMVAIGCFNWIVNPYGIYHLAALKIFENKPLVSSHLRLSKAMSIRWHKPDILIMGSSTAETGLDPLHPAWASHKVYNLGLSGANVYEVKRYLEHAESIHSIKKVVIVVNFFMFNAYSKNRDDFDESILAVDSKGNKNQFASTILFKTLFSYDALKGSIETIKHQEKRNAFLANGQLVHDYRLEQINQLKGYKNNFIYVEGYNKINLLPAPHAQYSFDDEPNNVHTMDYFKQIINLCEKNNTELLVIVAPEHVRLQETYHLLGLDSLYQDWLKKMTALIDEHNSRNLEQHYSVWNFNLVNAMTAEALPPKNSLSKSMQWFWDPFHFKNELGNEILNIVLGHEKNKKQVAIKMHSNQMDKFLSGYYGALKTWEDQNKVSVKELQQLLA